MSLAKALRRFRIDKPDKFRLADLDTADTCGLDLEKAEAKAMLADGVQRLAALQEKHKRELEAAFLERVDPPARTAVQEL